MIKIIKPSKDTYITNRVTKSTPRVNSNVGAAGTLDLFKLCEIISGTANIELTRLLIDFDLSSVVAEFNNKTIDIDDDSFVCTLNMYDVYGGQPTPKNFTVNVNPLMTSFDEGSGSDVVYYSDIDVSNFLTASWKGGTWHSPGCSASGSITDNNIDYVSDIYATQTFELGDEDLSVDVTNIISSSLDGAFDFCGFRIALAPEHESDEKSYFVKRFASRTAYNKNKHPNLTIKFDDSILDDSLNLKLNVTSTIYLFNDGQNFVSASNFITGSNCMTLKLTPKEGGEPLYYSVSQHSIGNHYIEGVYRSTFVLPSELTSSSLIPTWQSNDGTVVYRKGEQLYVNDASINYEALHVSATNIPADVKRSDTIKVIVTAFDRNSLQLNKPHSIPVQNYGIILPECYYQVRNAIDDAIVIPFDIEHKSTRISRNNKGMYFMLDASNLIPGELYVIDVIAKHDARLITYSNVSPRFRVT